MASTSCAWGSTATAGASRSRAGAPPGRGRSPPGSRRSSTSSEPAGYADRPIGEVSGGEQQRLLIAQALVQRPELLLLDEPLDSLDLPNQAATAALISDICATGVAVVLVAHDVNPILPYLDRVIYLAHGGAVEGTPERGRQRRHADAPLRHAGRGAAHERRSSRRRRSARSTRPPPPTAPVMLAFGQPTLSWNLAADLRQLLEYRFMVDAFVAGTIVAVVAAPIGWFMVLRRQTFAGHTLARRRLPRRGRSRADRLQRQPRLLRVLPRCRARDLGGARVVGRAPTARSRP